ARHPDRPYALDYIHAIFGDFFELHGDRVFGDDHAIIGGPAALDKQTVMVIAQQKGRTTAERAMRNFGMANPEGYRKALRLIRQAERFQFPIVAFVDTTGAFPGAGAEERGIAWAIRGLRRHPGALAAIAIDRLVEERYQPYRKVGA